MAENLKLLKGVYDNELYISNIKSLKELHEIMEMRHVAAYENHERLSDIHILDNLLWLDSNGNTFIQYPTGREMYYIGHIPNEDDKCPHCGKGWTLNNLRDFVSSTHQDDETEFFHHKCNTIIKFQNQMDEFMKILHRIYTPGEVTPKAIANPYCSCDVCAPWFIMSTPDGDIKIGWRKRVISIKWMENYKPFTETFSDDAVTKGFGYTGDDRMIHAWSIDDCTSYLRRAKQSIIQISK